MPKKYEYRCQYCGKIFQGEAQRKRHKYMYCSVSCRNKGVARQKVLKNIASAESVPFVILTCKYCNTSFMDVGHGHHSLFCSKECSYNYYKRRTLEKRALSYKGVFRVCKCCGQSFELAYKKSKIFCSEKCKKKYAREIARRNSKHRLDGKIIDHDITLLGLAKRDHDICGLCGGVVDWNDYEIIDGFFVAGDNYPSVDHVLPISRGGMHEWNNVQLAHFRCNTLKGAGTGAVVC